MKKTEQCEALRKAARALLAHWDTPAWKYLKPTGDLMADLREALAAPDWEAIGKEQLRRYKEKFGDFEQAEQEPLLWGDDKFAPHERPQKQEPVAIVNHEAGGSQKVTWLTLEGLADGAELYLHPVHTKDLTDDEIVSVLEYYDHEWDETTFAIARAVIAADREKNK